MVVVLSVASRLYGETRMVSLCVVVAAAGVQRRCERSFLTTVRNRRCVFDWKFKKIGPNPKNELHRCSHFNLHDAFQKNQNCFPRKKNKKTNKTLKDKQSCCQLCSVCWGRLKRIPVFDPVTLLLEESGSVSGLDKDWTQMHDSKSKVSIFKLAQDKGRWALQNINTR